MRMIAGFLGVLLTAVLLAVLGSASPASAVSCTTHYSADYRYVTKTLAGRPDPKWRVMHELRYRHCKQRNGRRWVDPLSAEIGCRREANPAGADLRITKWRMRYFDHDHHEMKKRASLECNRNDWTTKILYYPDEQRFHRCAAGSPRWRARVKFDIALDTDVSTKLAGHWWGYSGPVAVHC